MQNLQRILVPTDFSDGANNALIYAINLAEQLAVEIHVLHVDSPNNIIRHNTDEGFEKLKHHYFFHRKAKPTFHTRSGDIHSEIIKEIQESRIDLVIIGMTRKLGIREMMFGSITAKLIDKPPCTIMSIPPKCIKLALQNIAIATDYVKIANPPELYVIKYLADSFQSRLSFFHVNSHDSQILENTSPIQESFSKVFEYNSCTFEEVDGEDLLNTIKNYKTQAIDLLVVLHHLKAIDRQYKRSVSKQLAFSTKSPLLIIPIK